MAPTVISRREDDLREERRNLLDAAQMTAKQLRAAARHDDLTGDQWDAFERLREIDFLLRNGRRESGQAG